MKINLVNKIAIDIGGTNTRYLVFNKAKQFNKITKKTDPQNFEKNFETLIKTINDNNVTEVYIGAPGPADYINGEFLLPPNLPGWWNKNIIKHIKKLCPKVKKVIMKNDAKVMALSNHMQLGFDEKDVSLFYTISTGIGFGIIYNNEVFEGFAGYSSEIANAPTGWDNRIMEYGTPGAVENISSGTGIENRYFEKTQKKLAAKDIFQLYEKDDDATLVLNNAIDAMANLVATTISIINPNKIIFDGSVSRNNTWFIDKVMKKALLSVFEPQKRVQHFISSMGDDSVLNGCIQMASQ